uniref:TadE/TadG family type IV pilus assembly protein n=1 Tax=Parerythrobacter lutipelagi TaxID=1964208 RepID=UPI0010F50649|nr:TadE/TadG family type IV pilus assembly protein [Parerythrobacter lutipelagi]
MITPLANLIRRANPFLGDRRGTATIELAIVLPVLSMVALGAVDLVSGFAHKMHLQQHAQAGADFVIANGETLPSESDIKAQITALSGLNTSAITITKWTECNAAKYTSGLVDCPGLSDLEAQYMQIDVKDEYQPILDIDGIADFVQTSTLSGSVVVRLPIS